MTCFPKNRRVRHGRPSSWVIPVCCCSSGYGTTLAPSPIVSPALIARDSVGNAYDHAMWARGFFATLECELLDRQKFKNQVDARMAVIDFIEGWYNRIGQSAPLRSGADPVPDRNYGQHTARATSRPIVESATRAQKSSVWRE